MSTDDGWPQDTLVAPPPPEPFPPPRPDRGLALGLLLGLLLAVLAGLGVLVAYLLTHREARAAPTTVVLRSAQTRGSATREVATPSVVGLRKSRAESALRALGLKPAQKQVSARGKPRGTVVAQSPPSNTKVAKGSQVLLSIAVARPVRAAAHRTVSTTPTTLAGTTTAATTTAAATTAATTTAATTPAPAAPTTARVPDLSGKNEQEAAQGLATVGLLASVFFVPGQDPLGTVEQQAKPAGTTVAYQSHVQINVSSGPGRKTAEPVPNVIGATLQQALAAINSRHLSLIYLKYAVDSRSRAGKIVQQSPLGGGHAPQNAQVIVYLGAFKQG